MRLRLSVIASPRLKKMSNNKNLEIQSVNEVETAGFIQQAIKANLPIETMEKLFALYERDKAGRAKEAYINALSKFQSECPVIQKTKKVMNKDGRTVRYQYAPLEDIIAQIKKPLTDNHLSYRWEVENKPDFIKAVAIITHELGHSENSTFEVPIDKEGFMTAPQKYASALTFAKRYSLCDALGISTADEDTDATDVDKQPDAKSDKAKIVLLLRRLGHEPTEKKDFEKVVKNLTKLPLIEKNYSEVVNRLDTLIKEKQEYENSKIQ